LYRLPPSSFPLFPGLPLESRSLYGLTGQSKSIPNIPLFSLLSWISQGPVLCGTGTSWLLVDRPGPFAPPGTNPLPAPPPVFKGIPCLAPVGFFFRHFHAGHAPPAPLNPCRGYGAQRASFEASPPPRHPAPFADIPFFILDPLVSFCFRFEDVPIVFTCPAITPWPASLSLRPVASSALQPFSRPNGFAVPDLN